jgi:PhoPQ-activated pathogenicity-related protein
VPSLRSCWTVLSVFLSGISATPSRADLQEYVAAKDPAFTWSLNEKIVSPSSVVYDLHLVSQVWQGIKWEHQLQIYQPAGVGPNKTLFLYNTGGHSKPETIYFGLELAKRMGAPVAFLYHIPNQPLLGDRKEDALIAETFVRFLNTGDEKWPLLFPMVKSVVKAMDTVQAFSKEEWKQRVERFVICGASKRGWTTWLTAVADPRVFAIAPMVIDTLNMKVQSKHQKEAFGAYSDEIDDYTSRGLVPIPETPLATRLWKMVDPYTYRDRLTLPKLLVLGSNDPYWSSDALNLYWDGLKGPKWICYVPNAGHDLKEHHENGSEDRERAIAALAAYGRAQITGTTMPRLQWTHSDADDKAVLQVEAEPAPSSARLWVADAPTQDFRKSPWKAQSVALDHAKFQGEVAVPTQGCRAFYGELDYDRAGLKYHLSTQLRIIGKPTRASD